MDRQTDRCLEVVTLSLSLFMEQPTLPRWFNHHLHLVLDLIYSHHMWGGQRNVLESQVSALRIECWLLSRHFIFQGTHQQEFMYDWWPLLNGNTSIKKAFYLSSNMICLSIKKNHIYDKSCEVQMHTFGSGIIKIDLHSNSDVLICQLLLSMLFVK